MLPGIGRSRPEHLGRGRVPADDFVQQSQLQLPVAGTAQFLVQEDGPQPLVFDLILPRLDQRPDLRLPRPNCVRKHVLERLDLLAAELLYPVQLLLELRFG